VAIEGWQSQAWMRPRVRRVGVGAKMAAKLVRLLGPAVPLSPKPHAEMSNFCRVDLCLTVFNLIWNLTSEAG